MSLTLYYHPLSSFCQKVLVALYENATPFTPHLVDFADPASRKAFLEIWPVGRFPVLHDANGDRTIPESSIIIEYLAQHYPGKTQLIPADLDLARQTRFRDRFFDLYVNVPMQKIVTDRLRPEGRHDPEGVEQARALMKTALDMIDEEIAKRTGARLRKPRDVVCDEPQTRRRLPRSPDKPPVIRTGAARSRALPEELPAVGRYQMSGHLSSGI
jgi:glutathione S-transferase